MNATGCRRGRAEGWEGDVFVFREEEEEEAEEEEAVCCCCDLTCCHLKQTGVSEVAKALQLLGGPVRAAMADIHEEIPAPWVALGTRPQLSG